MVWIMRTSDLHQPCVGFGRVFGAEECEGMYGYPQLDEILLIGDL